ncbi:MAG: hypothetical protein O2887_09395 [Bacteroidetes bacterium]|nr:hypothetical protein [Bacteroidota bacterium]
MNRTIIVIALTLLFTGSSLVYTIAQCCSGGVPLANNIGGLPIGDKGTFQASLSFDGNFLRTLKAGSSTLDDKTRNRTTFSALLKTAYSFSDKWTVELLVAGVNQRRKIDGFSGNQDNTETTGIGDMVLMPFFKYYEKNSWQLTGGLGIKIPIGPSNLRDRGITLNADLQPGSGAWDLLLHHRIVRRLKVRPSTVVTNMVTYRFTGENPDYLSSQIYEFGSELQFILGISDQRNFLNQIFRYGLNFRYRHANHDRFRLKDTPSNENQTLPNSGGQWVFIMPVLSWYINPDMSIAASGEAPLFSKVDGTQLTPTFRINVGIFYTINLKKKQNIEINNYDYEFFK